MGTRRAARLLLTLLVALVAASASVAAGAGAHTATTVANPPVTKIGRYTVIVGLRARKGPSELVTLYVPGSAARRIRAYATRTVHTSYTLNLGLGRLSIRAAARGTAVRLSVSLRRVGALQAASPTTGATGATGPSTGGVGATGATGATGLPTPPPPVTASGPTTPPSTIPFQTLTWLDDFVGDYNSGMTEPNPAVWSYDTWGGCGNGTQSNFANGSFANVQLTPQGLAITAIADGSGGYSSAQMDTVGHMSIPNGAYVSASIAFPQGQGLCPAFWMMADQPALGELFPGEIDVVEAPAFVGQNLPPYAAHPQFVLHGPVNGASVQEWIKAGNPKPWNPTQFNTYGVQWTANAITWYVNNVPLATFTSDNIPSGGTWASFLTNFHVLLDLAVGSWPGTATVPSATMYVQWVKVFT